MKLTKIVTRTVTLEQAINALEDRPLKRDSDKSILDAFISNLSLHREAVLNATEYKIVCNGYDQVKYIDIDGTQVPFKTVITKLYEVMA